MTEKAIAKIRGFNRFYTTMIGVLDQDYLQTDYTVTEARILFELNANEQGVTAQYLAGLLRIDKGYLSRLIQTLFKAGLLVKEQEKEDKRAFRLRLSKKGAGVFHLLNARSEAQVARLLSGLSAVEVAALIDHMDAIEKILIRKVNGNG
jgi:DNA-binding MarR family transcriptional regulator